MNTNVPSTINRIISVWYRHVRVYNKLFLTNSFPVFIEPILFLTAIGFGLGKYIGNFSGGSYIQFIAPGIIASTVMYTATFELTFGTYIRLEFEKIYQGILATPVNMEEMLLGELLFAGTKGFFFSACILIIISLFGLNHSYYSILIPIIGFIGAFVFGAMAMIVTSIVKNIDNFNFYITGIISPMFFLSGIILPLDSIPVVLKYIAYALPLAHIVDLIRALVTNNFSFSLILNLLYLIIASSVLSYIAIRRMRERVLRD